MFVFVSLCLSVAVPCPLRGISKHVMWLEASSLGTDFLRMNDAFVALRNVAKTNKQDATTAKSLNLVLVEKNEKLEN